MKTKIKSRGAMIITLLFSAVVISSCVSSKKYEAAVSESDQLKAQNKELTNANAGLKNQVTAYEKYKQECDVMQADYQTTKSQLKTMQEAKAEEDKTMAKVEEKIYKALLDFIDRGAKVENKDGNLYVSLQDNLLYKSGSSQLGDEGKKALGLLASILNDYPKLRIVVVGHTDTVKFKGGTDNWSLSTERANSVVRVLRDDYKINPTRLTAAGRGKYDPVSDNLTAEGRAKNRRTEIIIRSDLERLWREAAMEK